MLGLHGLTLNAVGAYVCAFQEFGSVGDWAKALEDYAATSQKWGSTSVLRSPYIIGPISFKAVGPHDALDNGFVTRQTLMLSV